jgi:hypothetical protein
MLATCLLTLGTQSEITQLRTATGRQVLLLHAGCQELAAETEEVVDSSEGWDLEDLR